MSDPINDQNIPTYEEADTINGKSSTHWIKIFIMLFVKLALSLIAGYLSWKCSAKSDMLLRILFTFIAIMFSEVYIVYYTIYRVTMGNKCPI